MFSLKKRFFYLLGIGGLVIIIDQATKYLVVHHLAHRISVIPGVFDLASVYNKGIAFGFFNGGQSAFKPALFVVLSVAVFIVLLFVYLFSKDMTIISIVSLSMIMGGAAGNIIDRLRLGYVVDFIDIFIKNNHWPTFNLADTAITVGAVMLAAELFVSRKKKESV